MFELRSSDRLRAHNGPERAILIRDIVGPGIVANGDINSPLFGPVVKAASPRLMQVALKFTF